jgi:hypothetical protein
VPAELPLSGHCAHGFTCYRPGPVVIDPKLSWRTVSQRGDSTGKQSRRSAMDSLDRRQENVPHDLNRAGPSATNWHCIVHFLFKQDRLISDLVDEIAIRWN